MLGGNHPVTLLSIRLPPMFGWRIGGGDRMLTPD
jgi:hypothetical protein